MMIRTLVAAAAAALLCCAGPPPAAAQIAVSGSADLPASGLRVALPTDAGRTYKLSTSWWLNEDDPFFDARDTIDEFNASGVLVAGNRVQIGYFDAGGCEPLLKGLDFAGDGAIRTLPLWGHSWFARYGVMDFGGTLGKRPAAALCTGNTDGRSILLQHFLTDQPETAPQSALLQALGSARILQNAWAAYDRQHTASIKPVGRAEVFARGETAATRTRTLPVSNIEVTFPADGYVWFVDEDAEDYDVVHRLLPVLPEISMEVLAGSGVTCADAFAAVADAAPAQKLRNLPAGWLSGPTVLVNGQAQYALCAKTGYGVVVSGVYMPPNQTDATEIAPLLRALAAAPLK